MELFIVYKNLLISLLAVFLALIVVIFGLKINGKIKYFFVFLAIFIIVFNLFYIFVDNFTSSGIDLAFW